MGTRAYQRSKTGICTAEECNKKHYALGFCLLHYRRNKKHVSPDKVREQTSRDCRSPKGRFTQCKGVAKRRGLEWGLTFAEFISFLDMPCYYWSTHVKPETNSGLDRIDNDKGYITGNVLPCCRDCNVSRADRYSVEEWEAAVTAIEIVRNKNKEIKMGFERLANLECDSSTALGGMDKKTGKPNPTSIEGYFIGSRDVPSPKSKTGFSKLHVFQTKKGNVGVWGKTNLDYQLRSVLPGTMTRVTFTGMKPTKNNPMYSFSIEVDKDNTIGVQISDTHTSDNSSSDYTDDDSSDYATEDAAPLDEPPAPRDVTPSTPTPNARARVNELLGKGRKTA